MEYTTRMRILDEALICFSENGYRGTNLRELASRLGLSKSALYRHFDSKEAIWNAVLDRMEEYYGERLGSPERLPPLPESTGELATMTERMLELTMNDPRVILTRRLLLTEQFRNARARELATAHFLTGTTEIFTALFAGMMEKGLLKQEDPELLAFAYTAPITALIQLRDREPERDAEIRKRARTFIRHFISIYGSDDTP